MLLIKNNNSLKRRLQVRFLIGALILWVFIIVGSLISTHHEIEELYDGELSNLANVLLRLQINHPAYLQETQTPEKVVPINNDDDDNEHEREFWYQIWNKNDELILHSANAPMTKLADEIFVHSSRKHKGKDLRVLAVTDPAQPYVVHVAQEDNFRYEVTYELLEGFYIYVLLSLPIIVFGISFIINKALKPLVNVSNEIQKRSPDNLSQVSNDHIPDEIKGIISSLNRLLTRLGTAFEKERQFIADAAHELRTPLAGLKAQAQIALENKARVDQSLKRIVEGVDRTSRLADQLLSLSRLDSNSKIIKENIKIAHYIDILVEEFSLLISKKKLRVEKTLDHSIIVFENEQMLYMLIRNLLENALRYSEDNTVVIIRLQNLESDERKVRLQIIDNGPGIKNEKLTRVFDRFYRDIQRQEKGSGLGLSIVKRIADLCDFQVKLENRQDKLGIVATVEIKG